MTEYYIPNSIKEIIDEFISSRFRPYTYKLLASRIQIDTNTLVQRIHRKLEFFEIEGDKPKIIKLKKDMKEIFFYRDKNKCQICRKEKDPEELLIRVKDPFLEKKNKVDNLDDWENIITCCQACKDINLIRKLSTTDHIENIGSGNFVWEYKEIEIREVYKKKNPYHNLYFPDLKVPEMKYDHYHEFNELNSQGWHHIIDENNERCEFFQDIMNYFGNQGWELVIMNFEPPEYEEDLWGNRHCIFKRKKNLEET